MVVNPADYGAEAVAPTSRRQKKELLALAGVWSDFDADRMIEALLKARHQAPPSPATESSSIYWMLTGSSDSSMAVFLRSS